MANNYGPVNLANARKKIMREPGLRTPPLRPASGSVNQNGVNLAPNRADAQGSATALKATSGANTTTSSGAPTWIPGFNGTTISPFVRGQSSAPAGGGSGTGSSGSAGASAGTTFQNASGKQVTRTSGIAPNGENADYYLIDGVTYKDPEGKNRIDYKTRVNTADGQYVYMPGGSYRVTGTIDSPAAGSAQTPAATGAAVAAGKSGPTATTYIDENGNRKTGYIIGGVTYKDAAGKERIGAGSIVNTGGGSYYLGQDGRGVAVQNGTGFQDTFHYGGRMYQVFRNQYGQAFVDPECTTPVPAGAQISMGGVTYAQDGSFGTIPTPQGIITQYGQSMQQAQDAAQQANIAQQNIIAENLRVQLQRIENQRRKAQQDYALANQTSYNAYRDAMNPYGINAEQIAALGLSESGFAETSTIALMNSYQQALAGNERDRLNALAEIELAANEAIRDGNNAQYEALATMYNHIMEIQMQGAGEIAQLGMQAYSLANDNRWKEREQEWEREKYDRDIEQREKDRELEWRQLSENERLAKVSEALEMLSTGISTEKIAEALGISYALSNQIAQMFRDKFSR